jgi:hypothetical protein
MGLLAFLGAGSAAAEPPLYAERSSEASEENRLQAYVQRVPELEHERGDRFPMIMWGGIGFEKRPPADYRKLLARGLTQHVRMDPKMLPTAKALQVAGSPVIMMAGKAGRWPYKLAGEREAWRHRYEEGYEPVRGGKRGACINVAEGWRKAGERVHRTLRHYKENGVTVDAVWMDWEGAWPGEQAYRNARHCLRCRRRLPRHALSSAAAFHAFAGRRFVARLGTHLAAPAQAVFPNISTTDWMLVYSSPKRRVRHPWWPHRMPPVVPHTFTATNPVAYGNTKFYDEAWSEDFAEDREHVDQFYTHQLLRNISDSAANRKAFAPEKRALPWVARWCPDVADPEIPILSRPRYREILRHIWLRGADGLQIFNPFREGYAHMAYREVEDAVRVYDEMLGHRPFLERGEVMNTAVPAMQEQGVIWSGLRLPGRALVRVFRPGGAPAKVTLRPWGEGEITLDGLREKEGRTHLLRRGEKGEIEAESR